MPKRKHSDFNGPASSDTRKLSMRAARMTNKFDQSVQIIIKGLKTARGFERQKLSRREKTARAPYDSVTLARLAEEVEALKKLDYQTTAERYLYKQLSKTKRIAENPIFKEFEEAKSVSTQGPKSTAEANIIARLFKSNPVKNVVTPILTEIRKLLGIEDVPAGKQDKTKAKKDETSKEKSEKTARKQKQGSISGSESGDEGKGVSRAEDMAISGDDASVEDFSEFDARLAPGSGSEGEESDEDEDDENDDRLAGDISDSVYSRSPSPDFSAEESDSSPPPKKTKASKAPAQTTTFLPSLMNGGYWSGSEEEATDDEAAAAAAPPKRKNRMGQQARRALWEKKFGEKANHVLAEQKNQKRNRDSGWDTKRGATGAAGGARDARGGRGGRGGHGSDPARPLNRAERRAAGDFSSHKAKTADDTGPLHPSWEAKKKQKEQAAAVFSGKKLTFD
ncbi:uncharacterized protein N7484_004258 [Penicillium longicatenatum]|uniref:uncharacterized protein n=1 Tax=Penicillium longicatenatum TaxID=1561947 RepID=UPI002546A358|nr:uncharacterized protein N7484_004258 [Penicillium longicatenatum]KAJ5650535.1 hypothetical protein N7484_004258 [Penicillium longicatenatum]